MAITPEGKIKKLVKDVIAEFDHVVEVDGFSVHDLYAWWPVPGGYGASSLDCIVGYRGCFLAIETKAPGENPTPRQNFTIAQIKAAGCVVLVIDSEAGCNLLRGILQELKNANHR